MIEIYTREAWLSYFNRYSCIVIEDDGSIYDGDEYRLKHIKYPIGYIKKGTGDVWEIYGEEYRTKHFCYPVGYINKEAGDVFELYGEEYRTKHMVFPVGYIQDNQYYSYDEYHRFVRHPEGYIKEEKRVNSYPRSAPSLQSENSGGNLSGGIGFILVIYLVGATVGAWSWITGLWGGLYAISTIVAVLIGAIIAFFGTKSFFESLLVIEASGTVLLWIAACIADFVMEGFTITWIFADILFGWLFTLFLCAFPALICAILVTGLKKIVCSK